MTMMLLFCLVLLVHASVSSSNVLVIGGTGRVGSAVVSKLLAQNIPTKVMVRDMMKAKNMVSTTFMSCMYFILYVMEVLYYTMNNTPASVKRQHVN